METTRQKKIARLIQKELAEMLRQRTGELAPGKMITVTTVRISPDLSLAKVYLSIFPSEGSEDILNNITGATRTIRHDLGQIIRKQIRIIPELAFFIDDSLDYIDNIDSLLSSQP